MSRFRDLPGGIDRASYMWPMISGIHPEHGSYQMDVHCLHNPATGERTLMAIAGYAKPNSTERRRRIEMVADTARGTDSVIEELVDSDITDDISMRLAATLAAHPGTNVVMMSVGRI